MIHRYLEKKSAQRSHRPGKEKQSALDWGSVLGASARGGAIGAGVGGAAAGIAGRRQGLRIHDEANEALRRASEAADEALSNRRGNAADALELKRLSGGPDVPPRLSDAIHMPRSDVGLRYGGRYAAGGSGLGGILGAGLGAGREVMKQRRAARKTTPPRPPSAAQRALGAVRSNPALAIGAGAGIGAGTLAGAALMKRSQAQGPMARQDAYSENMPGMGAMLAPIGVGFGVTHAVGRAVSPSTTMMQSLTRTGWNPAVTAATFAAPGARRAQVQADAWRNSNTQFADSFAGLPKTSAIRGRLADMARARLGIRAPEHPLTGALRSLGAQTGSLAIALPIAGAVYAGGTAGLTALDSAQDRLAEPFRRNRALRRIDMEDLYDQGLGNMMDDPEDLRDALHKSFRVLNKYAPSVAKDPDLAAGVMTRVAQNTNQYTRPTDYLSQVREAVDLESAIRGNRVAIPHQLAGGLMSGLAPGGLAEGLLEPGLVG